MKVSPSSLPWLSRHLPLLVRAGVFPMLLPGCNRSFSHETIALHLHDYAGEMWIGKKCVQLLVGDITFSPNSITTRYALSENGSHLCIHFLPPNKITRSSAIELPLLIRLGAQTIAARERIWRIIDHVRQSGENPDSPAACAASASLQELLLWLHLQNRPGTTSRRGRLAEEALVKLGHAIDASLDKPMLIGDLAKNVGLSSEYVAKLFAQRHGMTLQHYILLRRIELARHLLISSDLAISEIGRRTGLPDPQYFNKQFRRIVNLSPLAYRRLHMTPG